MRTYGTGHVLPRPRRGLNAAPVALAGFFFLFAAAAAIAAEGESKGGASAVGEVTVGKLRIPGKKVEKLPFGKDYFKEYGDKVNLTVPKGKKGREFRVVISDKSGKMQAFIDVALFKTWRDAQQAVIMDGLTSRITYLVTPKDGRLGIGDMVFFAWDGPVEDVTKEDEGKIIAISFTRNNVGVIAVFENAHERSRFVKLIRAMDKKLIDSLVAEKEADREEKEPAAPAPKEKPAS